MLHIVNGEATLPRLEATKIGGDRLAWFDMLMEGPLVEGLRSDASWELRARYLARQFGIPAASYLTARGEAHRQLAASSEHEDIVLWFEGDLFCLLNLTYILQWLSGRGQAPTNVSLNVSLICPAEKRLGTLTAEEIRSLFEERLSVGPARLRLAADLWSALTSPDVSALRRAATWDFSAWPLLRRAVTLQLQRLPPREGALSAVEKELLALLREAPTGFGALFGDFSLGHLGAHLGLGDLQVAGLLHDLAWGDPPLVEITPLAGKAPPLDQQFGAWQITMTGAGRAVLQGEQLRTSRPEFWLGGSRVS
jgi:hypothetical protein